MADLNYKIIGNLAHVRTPEGMQLSVAYLLVDQHPEDGGSGALSRGARQVRGYGWAGNHVFTVWIEPEDKLEWRPCESNMKLMTHDGDMKDIGPAGLLTIGAFECSLVKSDPDKPFFIEDYACETAAPEQVIDKLVCFYRAPNIATTVYVPVAARRSRLESMGRYR